MRYFTLHVSQPSWMLHPMQEFIREEDVVEYEELLTWNFMRGEDIEYELFYVVADREPYEAKISSVESVREYTITPVDDESFYVYVCQETREADLQFRKAFAELEVVPVPPVVYDDRADMTFTLVGDGENLGEVIEETPDGLTVTVEEIGSYDRRQGTVAGALTDRQFEAVQAAVELGYYETPRRATLEDVGDRLGCAASTASNLLCKAEAAVMGRIAERPVPG